MSAEQEGDGHGDFALYLWESEGEQWDRVIRSSNCDELLDQGVRLAAGGRFKYVWLYRWNYKTGDDDILVAEIAP